MRVMILVKATEDSEKVFKLTLETKAMMEAMGRYNDELVKAGIMKEATAMASRPHRRASVSHSMAPAERVVMGRSRIPVN